MEKLGLRFISIIASMVLMASLGFLLTRSKETSSPARPDASKQVEPEAAAAVAK